MLDTITSLSSSGPVVQQHAHAQVVAVQHHIGQHGHAHQRHEDQRQRVFQSIMKCSLQANGPVGSAAWPSGAGGLGLLGHVACRTAT
jgi:hypothetical protein